MTLRNVYFAKFAPQEGRGRYIAIRVSVRLCHLSGSKSQKEDYQISLGPPLATL